MTNRERVKAILHYQAVDRVPVVHFGFWGKTLQKWADEGHLTQEEIKGYADSSPTELVLTAKLGFDFNWQTMRGGNYGLMPPFESKVLEVLPDGFRKVVNGNGVIHLEREGAGSIPAEIDHLLKGRKEWDEMFKSRLQYHENRIKKAVFAPLADDSARENPIGLHAGSLYGSIRNIMGVTGISYLYADDEDLYTEIIDTVGELSLRLVKEILATGAKFDFGHFWEDICFKNGPLVSPQVFAEKVGPHYRKITDEMARYGIDIVSLDCDGLIDALVPVWLENGVNTMFPIEVGTWEASIANWRRQYGRKVLGVGGMDKRVFSRDKVAVDREIERLKSLVELGGYIPCPDHRLPPDARFENVVYYAEQFRRAFGRG